MSRDALLIVSRANLAEKYGFDKDVARRPVQGLSHQDVANKYRGFEGEFWGNSEESLSFNVGSEDGLADPKCLPELLKILKSEYHEDSDLLLLAAPNPARLPDGFVWQGFDFGYFESIYNHYSVLYNEVIYGLNDQMRVFGSSLNENLLLDSLQDVERLASTRLFLLKQGMDLEDDSDCYPVGIWSYDASSCV